MLFVSYAFIVSRGENYHDCPPLDDDGNRICSLFIMFNYFYNIIKTYIELAYLLFLNKNNLIVILL